MSNGTFQTALAFYRDDYGISGDGREYVFQWEGPNIFGEPEQRVIRIRVDYLETRMGPPYSFHSGFVMGPWPYANIELASDQSDSGTGYFGYVYLLPPQDDEADLATFGFTSSGWISCSQPTPKIWVDEIKS